jgi:hypothetical protein
MGAVLYSAWLRLPTEIDSNTRHVSFTFEMDTELPATYNFLCFINFNFCLWMIILHFALFFSSMASDFWLVCHRKFFAWLNFMSALQYISWKPGSVFSDLISCFPFRNLLRKFLKRLNWLKPGTLWLDSPEQMDYLLSSANS